MLASDEAAGRGSGNDDGGRVVAVYSGKGGVGRTTVTVNLAAVLASEHRRRVVALDMDLQYGDLATVVPTPDGCPTIADLMAAPADELDATSASAVMVDGPGGFKLIACPQSPELSELVTPAHVSALLAVLRHDFDYILVDCGGHLADATTAVTDVADTIILLTSPTAPSLKSLRLALGLFEKLGVNPARVAVVLNHPDDHADYSDEEVEANLEHRVAVSLPHDSRTAVMAIDSAEPFVFTRPRSPLALGIRRLASILAGNGPAAERRGLIGMLAGRDD